MSVKLTTLHPQYTLIGTCGNDVQATFMKFESITNSEPWQGHAAGTLYISNLAFGGHRGDEGPFEIGFRKRSEAEGSYDDQDAIDFAELPIGTWSEVKAS